MCSAEGTSWRGLKTTVLQNPDVLPKNVLLTQRCSNRVICIVKATIYLKIHAF